MRILSNVLTLACALIAAVVADRYAYGLGPVLGFPGGVFGFWLSYTGRLARMFRKVS